MTPGAAPPRVQEGTAEPLADAVRAALDADRQAARAHADQILADAQAALRRMLAVRNGGPPSLTPDGDQPMPFPTPLPPLPDRGHPQHKTPMEIAQELADAAMAASEAGIRAAMEASQRAVEAAAEAAQQADAAAEEAVRRAAEANGDDSYRDGHR